MIAPPDSAAPRDALLRLYRADATAVVQSRLAVIAAIDVAKKLGGSRALERRGVMA